MGFAEGHDRAVEVGGARRLVELRGYGEEDEGFGVEDGPQGEEEGVEVCLARRGV